MTIANKIRGLFFNVQPPVNWIERKSYGSGDKQVAQELWEPPILPTRTNRNCKEYTSTKDLYQSTLTITHSDGTIQTWILGGKSDPTTPEPEGAERADTITICYDANGYPIWIYRSYYATP